MSGETPIAPAATSEPPVAPDSAVRIAADNPAPKRRSSIRPAAPDWRPSPRATSEPPRPMVVVYGGESERPPLGVEEDPIEFSFGPPTPRATVPFLLTRDLAPPAVPKFETLAEEPVEAAREAGNQADLAEMEANREQPERTANESGDAAPAPSRTADDAPAVALAAEAFSPARSSSSPPAAPRTSRPPARKRRSQWLTVVAVSVALGGIVAIAAQQRGPLGERVGSASPGSRSEERPANAAPPALTASAEASLHAANEGSAPVEPSPAATTADEPAAVQARPTSTLVVVEVIPWDAKVAVKGVQQSGPPFVFDIPPGKRIAIEVARRGFVTRRAVIDGSVPRVAVGLLSNKVANWRDNLKSSVPGAKQLKAAVKEPEAPVQSGL